MSVRSARYNRISLRNPKGTSVLPEERDAWAFLDAAGITSSRQQEAIITLVRDLKHARLWTKMKAIYPFVGGTASTHKWNLKDPRDVDAAFRLTFSGGWTHTNTGALPNGTNGYADTFVKPNTNLTDGNFHLSFYSRTANDSVAFSAELCTNSNPYNAVGIVALRVNNKISGVAYFSGGDDNAPAIGSNTTAGFAIGTETSTTSRKFIKNNTILGTNTTLNTSALTNNTLWMCYTGASYAIAEAAFASIGDGLTDSEATLLYNCVDRYQKFLGRAV